ncbi:MAG: DUF5103 domain-containing protein [Ferruginibacter sp.]|nr:DUF5103 domain-containing protein [Ferruginibacter sp.]
MYWSVNRYGFFSFFGFFFFISILSNAQHVERIYAPYIKTAQLFEYGNQQGLPVYVLNGGNRLELEFDDMEGGVKNYYYSFLLCDYNWKPSSLNVFDYVKGFTQNRINTYRFSSIAFTRYTHYQAFLPEQNAVPTQSGNYLLKVYLDGDTSKTVFTKQMLVVEPKAIVSASVVQPFTPQLFSTHQRVRFSANIKDINSFSAAQQVKVVVLQNNRWDNSVRDIQPTYIRGNLLEYNTEQVAVFPGGKEWRWLDLRSFRLLSDRVDSASTYNNATDIFLKTDIDRSGQRYVYYPDFNGMYQIVTYESINPFWQGDYASVHFNLKVDNHYPSNTKDIFLAGQFTGYQFTDEWKMNFNKESGKYECKTFLKQGYYNYTYIMVDKNNPELQMPLEGNYWEAENSYTILVYYKSFTDRNDRLIGCSIINSRTDKPGFSF